jgi:methylated-DNA-[protein]-cysteine S-methyltransferase
MMELRYTCFSSPLGMLGLAATDAGLCRLDMKVDPPLFRDQLEARYARRTMKDDGAFIRVRNILDGYFQGTVADFNVDIDFIEGTGFQRRVWQTLMKIPFGQVRSYAWVARRIGQPRAVRAVGQANGRNPVSIIVPCHRVIRSDGTIGGYGGGVEVKEELLKREGVLLGTMERDRVAVQTYLRL